MKKKLKKMQKKGSTFDKTREYAEQYSAKMRKSGGSTVRRIARRMGEKKL